MAPIVRFPSRAMPTDPSIQPPPPQFYLIEKTLQDVSSWGGLFSRTEIPNYQKLLERKRGARSSQKQCKLANEPLDTIPDLTSQLHASTQVSRIRHVTVNVMKVRSDLVERHSAAS